jgi:hypothetical protein
MNIGNGFLTPAEKQLFIDILFEYEAAIAFDESKMGLLDPSIEPPVIIHTVPHTAKSTTSESYAGRGHSTC